MSEEVMPEVTEEVKTEEVVEEAAEEKKPAPELEEAEVPKVEEPKVVKDSEDIKDTKEMLQLAFAIGKMLVQAKKNDGNIDLGDMPLLVNLFPVVGPALEDVSNIPAELKDLSDEEVRSLLVFSAAHLGELAGTDEELVSKIEKGLALALAIADFVKVL